MIQKHKQSRKRGSEKEDPAPSEGAPHLVSRRQRYIPPIAMAVLVLSVLVILGGAFVRISHSGAGCGDEWPTCKGSIVPAIVAFETAVEWLHRASSGLVWIGALLLYLMARFSYEKKHLVRRAAFWSFFFMCTEALIGALLVVLELVAKDASAARAVWVSGHLINTFLLIAALTLTFRWSAMVAQGVVPRIKWDRAGRLACLGLLIFLPVGVTGAIAALGDSLFPTRTLSEAIRLEFSPAAHFLLRLRVLHPVVSWLGAFVMCVIASLCWWKTRRLGPPGWILLLVGAQIFTGFANVFFLAPTGLQIAHLLLADLLWIALICAVDILLQFSATGERTGRFSFMSRDIPQRRTPCRFP